MTTTVNGILLTSKAPFWETWECLTEAIDDLILQRISNNPTRPHHHYRFCRTDMDSIGKARGVNIMFTLEGNARCLTVHFRSHDYQEFGEGDKLMMTLEDNPQGQELMLLLTTKLAAMLQVSAYIYSEDQEKVLWQKVIDWQQQPETTLKVMLSRKAVEEASVEALLAIDVRDLTPYIVERQPDGGIVDDRLSGAEAFYPIGMVKEQPIYLNGGDWTVIPYVRGAKWNEALQTGRYHNFYMEWKA